MTSDNFQIHSNFLQRIACERSEDHRVLNHTNGFLHFKRSLNLRTENYKALQTSRASKASCLYDNCALDLSALDPSPPSLLFFGPDPAPQCPFGSEEPQTEQNSRHGLIIAEYRSTITSLVLLATLLLARMLLASLANCWLIFSCR